MHNGYFRTLRGTVVFYNDRDKKPRCGKDLVAEDASVETEMLAGAGGGRQRQSRRTGQTCG